ncbi:cell division control protein 14, SIN component-domain-containing protein [Abortiporus biennis]|nr:cell division control protein 14, SIN component-domain-containing protein [Abortiporus biennis]
MSLPELLQDALDDLSSTRTSNDKKGSALNTLERFLAEGCVPSDIVASNALKTFLALQDTFQCNVPSRMLTWIADTTSRLDGLTSKGTLDKEKATEVATLSRQLIQGLIIIQGVALSHGASKQFLGRKYALEVFLDLLLTSRHVTSSALSTTTNTVGTSSSEKHKEQKVGSSDIILASTVLDTLLCILVDSCPALRHFEECNGLQYVVRILKRAGTPREVRMKCLEFLYFYLMDETKSPLGPLEDSSTLMVPTAPNSPTKGRSTSQLSDSSVSSLSSTYSTDSSSTAASFSTYATSFSSSSFAASSTLHEPQPSPTKRTTSAPDSEYFEPNKSILMLEQPQQSKSLLMLRKDIDYVPLSPKKTPYGKIGVGTPKLPSLKQREIFSAESQQPSTPVPRSPTKSRPQSRFVTPAHTRLALDNLAVNGEASPFKKSHRRGQSSVDVPMARYTPIPNDDARVPGTRTMEEKKEILGSMLGNVDALIQGVQKAGIFGLN